MIDMVAEHLEIVRILNALDDGIPAEEITSGFFSQALIREAAKMPRKVKSGSGR